MTTIAPVEKYIVLSTLDSVFFFSTEKDKAVIALNKKGIVGGYKFKLSSKFPFNNAKTER